MANITAVASACLSGVQPRYGVQAGNCLPTWVSKWQRLAALALLVAHRVRLAAVL